MLIFLHPDEWAPDVPLPEGSTIVHLGENREIPFHPQWHFHLLPDKTVELLVGHFVLPLLLEEATIWYQTELPNRGWVSGPEEGYRMLDQALLRFWQPEACLRVEVSLQWWPSLRETTAMIRRVAEHPWPAADQQPVPVDLPQPAGVDTAAR